MKLPGFFAVTAALLLANPALGDEPISIKRGVTLGGHDTVAYHAPDNVEEHRAVKGDDDLTVEYAGAAWRFSSAENRDAFLADPERYRPAYGGHCANALSLGEGLIRTDGKTWEIFDDKLYVYYAPRGRKRWNDGNWQTYKQEADRAWQQILASQ